MSLVEDGAPAERHPIAGDVVYALFESGKPLPPGWNFHDRDDRGMTAYRRVDGQETELPRPLLVQREGHPTPWVVQ